MTAVIYARYSSDNQREESIEGQIRECTAYAEKNGITVVKHYIDRALSAKTDNRPDFQQMIKDSEKRLFDIVLVWKLDRFARNRYDSAHYEYQLERNHVKLVSATEPISDSPAGIMVKSMLTGMAEYYSAELSEKVVRGMTENVLKGKYNGGTIPIGFKVDEEKFFQVDPLKAPFVVEAFQRYNDGATMKELMNWLNDSGVTTNRNQKFTYNSVQTLLTNKRYIGENHFKDIVMPDSIPAIVDKDLFEEVQQKIKKNSRAPARHKAEDDYLLTTKLFCGMCGAMMFGECGTGRNKVVHHYYKCATAKRFKTCKKKTVRKEWLEDLVVAETMKLIQDDAVIDAIVAEVMELQDQENTTLPLLEKQMREVENGIENILALRGDRVEGVEPQKDFTYASDLCRYIASQGDFDIAGACYPEVHSEATDEVEDIHNLRKKVESGASHLISQLFFDNSVYYRFLERAKIAGVNVPIEAGIMPVTSKSQIERMVSMCGASLPAKFAKIMQKYDTRPEALRDAGIAYAVDQIVDLIAHGVDGIHLYTMNNPYVARKITEAVSSLL